MTRAIALCLALCTATAVAQNHLSLQPDRIASHPNLNPTTRLKGHIPNWARAENDLGSVPDATPMRLALVLSRSPERQSAFTQLLADQQNPASAGYHQWLTPQQVGELYGPTQHDLDALTAWLTAQGLAVAEIAPSRVFVNVTATAAVVSRAFATSLHSFRVEGSAHTAPTAEPGIPAAFLPLVGSIAGLADTPIHPMHQHHSMAMPGGQKDNLDPDYTTSAGNHFVTPGDFATIFDLKPTYSAGINGAGQKIAIIGRSRVVATDISEFEANTGLAANLPNTIIPTTGVDPGVTNDGDQGEATLDLVRVIGTAPGVQADLVVSGTTGGFNGIYIAAQYNVQTLLDPVMNISFGSCEVYAGPSQVNLWDTLFAQASSEGISVFVSAADSGAATCDTQFGAVPTYQFRSINYICASSYATCVGGTEFADSNSSAYWSTTNGTGLTSALSYIPEGAWNEPQSSSGTYVAASGGGGASIYIPKPSWQAGTGVPADGARDVPDVSFPASGHDGYYACYAAGNGDCAANRFEYFSGTSAAAPTMAAVTALLNQKTGGSHGNLNPLLYRIAAGTPAAFHDATPASSGVASCSTATASLCNNSLPSPTGLTGGLAGYALTPGYDQATGLGSLDITNFLNAASVPTPALAAGKLTLTEAAATITNTQTDTFTATYSSTTSGNPGGTVQFYANNSAIGPPLSFASSKAVTAPIPFPGAGSYDITAIYTGDATFAQTTAPGIALTVTGLTTTPKVTLAHPTIGVGDSTAITVTVPGTGTTAPTGMVRILATGPVSGYVATVPVSQGTAISNPVPFAAVGTYTLTAYYLGDTAYSTAVSSPVTLSVQRVSSLVLLNQTSGSSVGVQGFASFTVQRGTTGYLNTPAATGTLQIFLNGVSIGSFGAQTLGVVVSQFNTAGANSITASYSGDINWQPATATPLALTVSPNLASYQVSQPLQPTVVVTAGATYNNGGGVQLIGANGFQGTITPVCSVAYNGSGSAVSPPTCAFTGTSSITLSSNPYASFRISSVASQAVKPPTSSLATERPGEPWKQVSEVGLLALVIFLPLRRGKKQPALLSFIFLFALILTSISGCGSSTSTTAQTPSQTPTPVTVLGTTKGSYTITVTASADVPNTPVPAPVTIPLTVN